MKKFYFLSILLFSVFQIVAQSHPALERFLSASYLRGASISIMVKDVNSDSVICSYDAEREVIPASALKIVTTSAALEILGENYVYETSILYDGEIIDSILNGNLYIRGGGDPSLGSADLGADRDMVLHEWVEAVRTAGIRTITGAVIADESIFDTEGVSMKWLREDLGSYYGQGCYGLNIYDNRYALYLKTEAPGESPKIERTDPELIPPVVFHNHLTCSQISSDSTYIVGFPFSNERYIYGIVPANRSSYKLVGDIPEPALFIAHYFSKLLKKEDISIACEPTCRRILAQAGNRNPLPECKTLITTYSRPLKDLVKIANFESNNLYADAFLKTIGLKYAGNEPLSSFGKGVKILLKHWQEKGLDTSSLWMFDGSGLAPTDKITARCLNDILGYMAVKSPLGQAFIESLPRAGIEGTVRRTLVNSPLKGHIRLKSGSMSRIRSYAGYITKNDRIYAVTIIVNNFNCTQSQIKSDIERLISGISDFRF